jgi:hypothetical protein
LNYIKTKVDYDVIKDVAKPLFDITNSEAVGSGGRRIILIVKLLVPHMQSSFLFWLINFGN